MPTLVALVAAAASGLAALALTGPMRSAARTDAGWLRSGVHVPLAALGGVGAAALAQSWAELVAYAILSVACALLVVIDLAAYRLPDAIIGPTYPVLFAALAVAAATGGDWARLGRAAATAVLVLLCYLVLAWIAPYGLGLGDVKLSGLLGGFLGWLGWSHALVGTCAAFGLGAVVSVALLVSTRASHRTEFAFGPAMVVGAALGAAYGPVLLPG